MKQKTFQRLLLLLTIGGCAVALAQNQTPIQQSTSGPGHESTAQASTSALRILTPLPGQALSNNFVTVRFELVRPDPGGSDHNFVVRLDGRDPINTSETAFTFTEITPGKHVLTVALVDANGNPQPDARAQINFSVETPGNTTHAAQSGRQTAPSK